MAHRQPTLGRSKSALPPQLAAVNLHAAGIAVGAEAHDVAVSPSDEPPPGRCFGADTIDLAAMADGWALCRSTTVALESTGVDWSPLVEFLERRGVAGLLVDPPQGRTSRGRPHREVHDCQGRQRRPTLGLRASAFRPPEPVCLLRSDLRQRAMWLTSAGQPIPPRPKARTQMHLKLQHVGRALTGETGMAIIRASLAGERDPGPLAHLRHDRCQHDEATMAKALQGQWREEHRCALAPAVALYERYHQPSSACARQLAAHRATCAAHSASEA